jgi:sigma-B regulation protein RsbQ
VGALKGNNVEIKGASDEAIVAVHDFGCDHHFWRFVAPAFEIEFKSAGGSEPEETSSAIRASI